MATAPGAVRTLRDHLVLLRRRLPIVVALTLLGALAALGVSLAQSPRYTSVAEVLVPQEPLTLDDPTQDQRIDQRRLDPARVLQDELRLAGSDLVRDAAEERLGRRPQVTVTAPKDADVLVFTGTGPTGADAAADAQAMAEAYVALRVGDAKGRALEAVRAVDREIEAIDARLDELARDSGATEDGGTAEAERTEGERGALSDQRAAWVRQRSLLTAEGSLVELPAATPRIITPAPVPSAPTTPTTGRNVVLGALAGLVLGLVTAYAVDAADDRIRDADDLAQRTGLPVLGTIPASSATTGTDAAGSVRLVPVGDPALATVTGGLALADRDGQVLLVPARTPARRVRQVGDVLRSTGVPLAAAVVVAPEA